MIDTIRMRLTGPCALAIATWALPVLWPAALCAPQAFTREGPQILVWVLTHLGLH